MPAPKLLTSPRTYAAWLALVVGAYVATYLTEPYVFALTVLGLGALSALVALCGVGAWIVALRRHERRGAVAAFAALIVAANVGAFAVLSTFRWGC